MIGLKPTAAQIGGSRAMAATSGRYAARLALARAIDPSADSARWVGVSVAAVGVPIFSGSVRVAERPETLTGVRRWGSLAR